jgi:hypothetical protein
VGGSDAEFVPLVTDLSHGYEGEPGWVSYESALGDSPDIEIIAGGLNSKEPEAAAIWRQGFLLHFGFKQTPAQMNDAGRDLLAASIAYIARFRGDRPLLRTPSAFAGQAPWPRRVVAFWFERGSELGFLEGLFDAGTFREAPTESSDGLRQWFGEVRPYLRPDEKGKLLVDDAARRHDLEIGGESFIADAIAHLDEPGVRPLLVNQVPEGPGDDASADRWRQWLAEHEPYLFYSEYGGYRWYVDPLAKTRGVPTAELRGPARADRPEP